MKMNRRGFLLAEETLKIVVAVIAIGFLIYFLTSLYLKSQESEKLEQAKASLEHLITEINLEHAEVEIYNPKGWVISSWPHKVSKWDPKLLSPLNTKIVEVKPVFCKNLNWNNCICICKRDTHDACDNGGICMNYEKELIVKGGKDIIDNPMDKVSSENSIAILNPPIKLKIEYGDKIIITKNEP